MTSLHNPKSFSSSQTKIRFARRFLRSLAQVNKLVPTNHGDGEEVRMRQSTRIKTLSYACMARAVGPRRAWSRAVIFRLRKRATCRNLKRTKTCRNLKRTKTCRSLAGKLREVVPLPSPRGEEMDTCMLLEETAHYVKCLAIQVQVMKTIADHLSSSAHIN